MSTIEVSLEGEESSKGTLYDYDTIGKWFQTIPPECHFEIPIGVVFKGESSPHWFNYDHRHFDGVGALRHLLKQLGYSTTGNGASRHVAASTGLKFWINNLRFLKSYYFQKKHFSESPWRNIDLNKKNDLPWGLAWTVLDEDQTTRLKLHARNLGVSINTLLLHGLNQSISDHRLKAELRSRNWNLPVNLRGRLNLESHYGNHSMACDVVLTKKDKVQRVHKKVHKHLAGGMPWLRYCHATDFFQGGGEMTLEEQAHHLGSQSNLGQWPQEGISPQSHTKEIDSLIFVPPVQAGKCIAAGTVTWQEKLCFAMQIHPSLSHSKEELKSSFEAWIKHTVSASDIELTTYLTPIEEVLSRPQISNFDAIIN